MYCWGCVYVTHLRENILIYIFFIFRYIWNVLLLLSLTNVPINSSSISSTFYREWVGGGAKIPLTCPTRMLPNGDLAWKIKVSGRIHMPSWTARHLKWMSKSGKKSAFSLAIIPSHIVIFHSRFRLNGVFRLNGYASLDVHVCAWNMKQNLNFQNFWFRVKAHCIALFPACIMN